MEQEVAGAVSVVKVSSPVVGEEDVVVGQERWEDLQRLKAGGMAVWGFPARRDWTARRCAAACGKCAGRLISGQRGARLCWGRTWSG